MCQNKLFKLGNQNKNNNNRQVLGLQAIVVRISMNSVNY